MLLLRELSNGKSLLARRVALTGDTITFGRGVDCTYTFLPDNPHVSRVQATLQRKEQCWQLYNGNPKGLRSANGVFYQGHRLDAPLELMPGMLIELFKRGSDRVELEYATSQPLQETYTGEGDLSEAIAAVRHDLSLLIQRIDERDQQIEQFLALPTAELHHELDQRMAFIADEMHKLVKAVESSQTCDTAQSQQLAKHEKLIRKVGLGMAAALLSLGGWNLTSGNKDAVLQSVNILFALAGGTGGTYLLQKQSQDAKK